MGQAGIRWIVLVCSVAFVAVLTFAFFRKAPGQLLREPIFDFATLESSKHMRVGPGYARIEIYKPDSNQNIDVRPMVRDVAVSAGFVPQPGDTGSLDSYHDESGRMIYYCGNGLADMTGPRIIYWRDADRTDEALRNISYPADGEISVGQLKAILAKSKVP